ncbi:MAG: 4Fe-4S binding protein [Halapricum sp.]
MASSQSDDLPEKFAEWKGIDRRTIEWHPTIDADACVGCGLCVTSCEREVFGYDDEQKEATVENPTSVVSVVRPVASTARPTRSSSPTTNTSRT